MTITPVPIRILDAPQLTALLWAADAVSSVPCPAECDDGYLDPEQTAPDLWVAQPCEWCAMAEYLREAVGPRADEEPEEVIADAQEEAGEPDPKPLVITELCGMYQVPIAVIPNDSHPEECPECGDTGWLVAHRRGDVGGVMRRCAAHLPEGASRWIEFHRDWAPPVTRPCAHESIEACNCGPGPEIHELVAADMVRRHETGVREYGVSLRDCRVDTLQYAYEEALDLALYLRKVILDRDRVMGSGESGKDSIAFQAGE